MFQRPTQQPSQSHPMRKFVPLISLVLLAGIVVLIIMMEVYTRSGPTNSTPLPTVATMPLEPGDVNPGVNKILRVLFQKHSIDPNFRYCHVTNSVTTYFEGEPIAFKIRNARITIQRIAAGLEISRYITATDSPNDYYLSTIPPSDYVGLDFPPSIGVTQQFGPRSPNYSKAPDGSWFREVMEQVEMNPMLQ